MSVKYFPERMMKIARSGILQLPLILGAVTLVVNVESNKISSAEQSIVQDHNGHRTCSIQAAEKVTTLNCSGVPLNDEVFEKLNIHVTVLDISYAGLTSLAVLNKGDLFRNMLVLNSSHNTIEIISEGTFKHMPYLEKIDLSFNIITHISDDAFISLSELTFLDLSNNKLTLLPNKLPMTEWFDISNNLISSISEKYSSVLYPQLVFSVGQNPFRCTCDLLWLKDLMGTRLYLLKFVQHLDPMKFIPTCSFPSHLAGKSWRSLEDGEFKCSESVEKDSEMSTLKLLRNTKEVKVTISEISYNSLILNWNGNLDENGKVLEIKFHRFGESKEWKKVILPFSVSRYRLRNLEPETPYIVCFTVFLGEESYTVGCEEIFTTKFQNSSYFSYIFRRLNEYSNHLLALLILCLTTLFILLKKENNKNEKYSLVLL